MQVLPARVLACCMQRTSRCVLVLAAAELTQHAGLPGAQKYKNNGKLGRELGASVSPNRTLLESLQYKTPKQTYETGQHRCAAGGAAAAALALGACAWARCQWA